MPPLGTPISADTVIDISHESLVRNWRRLYQWVDEEARSARTYRRIAETATLYIQGRAGLFRGRDLEWALQWKEISQPNKTWAKRYQPEFDNAMAFLDESQANHEEEIKKKEAARMRELKQAQELAEEQKRHAKELLRATTNYRRLIVALVTLLLLTLSLEIFRFITGN